MHSCYPSGLDLVIQMAEIIPISYANERRAPRYYFGGAAELIHLDSGQMIVALVRSLSLCGCFIKTEKSFGTGTNVLVKVAHSGTQFSAKGRIAYRAAETDSGIGIEFTDIDATDRERLEELLGRLA
jgi:Tfp pilus assembly protein PilZ